MKRTITLILLLLTSTFGAFAQRLDTVGPDRGTVLFFGNAVAILLTIWMISSFLLALVRLFLNDRLRRTLLEKNASEETIAQILPPKSDFSQLSLKWCCLFAATGIGLTICYLDRKSVV